MVNVQKYQWVAIGDTIKDCEKNYVELLNSNGIVSQSVEEQKTAKGVIESIAPIVLEGTTHYYICLKNDENIYDVDMTREELVEVIRCNVGDTITLQYEDGYGINPVTALTR